MNGEDIRRLRRRRGWTQAKLAQHLGTDAVTVSRWERNVSAPRPSAQARLGALKTAGPDVISLVDALGNTSARKALRRALLLQRKPRRHRFADEPTRRLREVDRARIEQAELKARMGVTP